MYTDLKLITFTSDKINLMHFVKSQHSKVILAAHFPYKFKQNTCSFKGIAENVLQLSCLHSHTTSFPLFRKLEEHVFS